MATKLTMNQHSNIYITRKVKIFKINHLKFTLELARNLVFHPAVQNSFDILF